MTRMTALGFALAAVIVFAGCAGGVERQRGAGPAGREFEAGAGSRTPKRVTAAIYGNPTSVISRMNTAQVSIPGATAVEQLARLG